MSSTQVISAEGAAQRSQPPETHELRDLSQKPSPTDHASPQAEAPESNTKTPVLKIVVSGYSFFISGVNDGTLGPLIPYILKGFRVGTGEIAIMYGCTFAGWALAAVLNPIFAKYSPLGFILATGALFQLASHCMRPWGPFPLYCVSFFVQAVGMALQDSHSNTFVSGLGLAHRWLGFIHASYAAGLLVGPLVATAIASKGGMTGGVESWRAVFFALIGIAFVNVVGVLVGFRDSLWQRGMHKRSNDPGNSGRSRAAIEELKQTVKSKALWLLSLAYFLQLGAIFTAGGWVVEYLTTVRGGDLSKMGYVPTGFYGGILLGRLLLAEPTHRLGEQRMVLLYTVLLLALQLVFWLVRDTAGSATALGLMGFVSGPFFPAGVAVASKLFPRKIRPAALGFVFVLAQAGGTFFPSITGVIAAQRDGVEVLQPVVTGLIVASGICWAFVPRVPKGPNRDDIPHFPDEDAKLRASSLRVRRGGNCPNTIEVLQQFLNRRHLPGSSRDAPPPPKVHLISPLPERQSQATAQIMASFPSSRDPSPAARVDFDHCLFRAGHEAPASCYILCSEATGSRTIVNHNDLPEMTPEEFLGIAGAFRRKGKSWWHFEGRIPETTLECVRILRRVLGDDVTVSVEVEKPGRPGLRELAAEADVVFYSKSWAEDCGYTSAEECLRTEKLPRASLAMITWGARGASCFSPKDQRYIESSVKTPVEEVVDSVGAGDTFFAGMLYGLTCQTDHWDLGQKLDFAVDLATLKVQREGFGGLGEDMQSRVDGGPPVSGQTRR
ncbi:putative mfs transporter protein [Colletotrichum karsti]|uniref:Mfs transporter protein n=1 Tax=Colletotrichum karsti TaxID=1095194 RepID=A0A9P6IF46_9PEZI|nr:putative mfs transporter protein [Colletotrichum karsti]KAF9881257.1 putative mfs transporter protein [Colletotrichum karsti]